SASDWRSEAFRPRRRCNRTAAAALSRQVGVAWEIAMRLRRPLMPSAAALIALSTVSGFAARAEEAQQNAAPKAETSQAATPQQGSGQDNQKSSGSNDQSGPSNAAPTASQDGQGDRATHSVSGRS